MCYSDDKSSKKNFNSVFQNSPVIALLLEAAKKFMLKRQMKKAHYQIL